LTAIANVRGARKDFALTLAVLQMDLRRWIGGCVQGLGAGAQATGMDLLMTLWRWQTWLVTLTVLLVLIVFWILFGL
jgi:hypothetical protein